MTDRMWKINTRTSRHIQWKYSNYNGRYSTVEECMNRIKEDCGNNPVEYNIENIITGEVITGFMNWKR